MKPGTEAWLRYAHDDLTAAELALREGLYQVRLLHCQQCIEKMLKAIWTERTVSGSPPRTHNLQALALDLRLTVPNEDLLVDLTREYGPSHYPDVGTDYTDLEAGAYVEGTRELAQWLRQQLS